MRILAQKLKELRKDKQLNQTEVAEYLGIGYYTLGKWEQGRAEPSAEDLTKLADFFGCSVDYLLGREDDFGNVATPGVELPADEQELLTNFRTLPREEKVQARSYVRYLAERRAPGNKHA